jgi:hypothetical protein
VCTGLVCPDPGAYEARALACPVQLGSVMNEHQIAAAQDAYHYAAVLAGKYSAFQGERDTDPTCARGETPFQVAKRTYAYMLKACAKAGISLGNVRLRQRSLADITYTATLVRCAVWAHCRMLGIDANVGMRHTDPVYVAGM